MDVIPSCTSFWAAAGLEKKMVSNINVPLQVLVLNV